MADQELWQITQLVKQHQRKDFDSGIEDLDQYLRRYARVNDSRGITRTFVATRPGSMIVDGYYAARSGQVAWDDLPDDKTRRRLPRYPIPVFHLARLAVDRTAQGKGLGETLLMHALHNAVRLSSAMGIYAVEVSATNDTARNFYLKYGFSPLEDAPRHLYISIKALRKVFPPDVVVPPS